MNHFLLSHLLLLVLATVALSTPPDYDEELAIQYMAVAGASYCDAPSGEFNLSNWKLSKECVGSFPDMKVTGTFFNTSIDAFGFVAYSEAAQTVFAAIKGTDPGHINDWLIDFSDLNTYTHNCSLPTMNGRAHRGFCEEYNALIKEGMRAALLATHKAHPSFQVVVTGHSLGAATANLMAIDLIAAGVPLNLYTYGEPRSTTSYLAQVSNEMFDGVDRSHYRVTHHRDLVAHLPPCDHGDDSCVADDSHPYHTGHQIHYASNMTQAPVHCSLVDGEDCNETLPISVHDHLWYFGQHLGLYCCPAEDARRPVWRAAFLRKMRSIGLVSRENLVADD